jgi:signal transduction histidine kinase
MGVTLHEFASANRDEILTRTIDLLADHASNVPRDQLAGSLPDIIDDVITALRDGALAPRDSLHPMASDASMQQGVFRFQAGFNLKMVVRCFGLICDSITALADSHGLVFAAHEFRVLNQCVDSGIADAVDAFTGQAQHTADSAERQRIGALAHELRNALATVSVGFDALKDGHAGFASKTAAIVGRGIRRMETLISQTLAEAKLQAGRLELVTQELTAIVREVVDAQPPSHVSLRVDIECDAAIEADRTLIVSALGNLVQNAVKFTRAGGTVTIRATADKGHGEVVIEVEDECGGLPIAETEALFEPFHQHDPSHGGAGLGLTIVRDAVAAHGGTVEARNRAPVGCVFRLRWPLSPRRAR